MTTLEWRARERGMNKWGDVNGEVSQLVVQKSGEMEKKKARRFSSAQKKVVSVFFSEPQTRNSIISQVKVGKSSQPLAPCTTTV
jgi:hypothetical protein